MLAIAVALVPLAMVLPWRGDEAKYYEGPLSTSMVVWPSLNSGDVHHGLSPLWLWVAGAVARVVGVPPVVGGRLVAVGCWAVACSLVLWRTRRIAGFPIAIVLLLHPLVLVYTLRAHPFVPALALLVGALSVAPRWAFAGWGLVGMAAHLQAPFAAVGVLWGWLLARGELRGRIIESGAAMLSAAAGVVFGWWMVGGRYAPGFVQSDQYFNLWVEGPVSAQAMPLAAVAMAGWWWWLLVPKGVPLAREQRWLLAIAAVTGAVLLAIHPQPEGPLRTLTFALVGETWAPLPWAAFCLVGALGWGRAVALPRWWLALAATAGVAAIFAVLPFFFERLAWWAAAMGLLAWSLATASTTTPARGFAFVAIGVLGAAVYQVAGRL